MKPGKSARRIAICIDDFGLHAGVNEAVFALAAQGRVQAVGCMVGAPAFWPGSVRLRGLDAAAIDVGLHLDFTEHPLHAASRSPLGQMIVRAYGRRLDAARLRAEIGAQLAAFEDAIQRPPAFIDGHQHVHQLPMVREALLQVLRERDATHRPWLRATRRPPHATGFKPWLIEALGAKALAQQAATQGLAQNAHLLGVYDFQGDAAGYAAKLGGWLQSASDGDVLMCHPSATTSTSSSTSGNTSRNTSTEATDPLLAARRHEYAVLASPALTVALAQRQITLAPISRVIASSA